MPYTPYAGPAGGVRIGSGSSAVAGIDRWSFTKTLETVPSTHFESAADSNGVVFETLLVGVASAQGSCEGTYDGDTASSDSLFPIGTQVVLDLLFKKSSAVKGILDLPAVVTDIEYGQDLRGKGTFRMSFKTTGVPALVT